MLLSLMSVSRAVDSYFDLNNNAAPKVLQVRLSSTEIALGTQFQLDRPVPPGRMDTNTY